jgi:hypothetical protein
MSVFEGELHDLLSILWNSSLKLAVNPGKLQNLCTSSSLEGHPLKVTNICMRYQTGMTPADRNESDAVITSRFCSLIYKSHSLYCEENLFQHRFAKTFSYRTKVKLVGSGPRGGGGSGIWEIEKGDALNDLQ